MLSARPNSAAVISAVIPELFFALISAFFASNSFMESRVAGMSIAAHSQAAAMKGVLPSLSLARTSASFSSSSFTDVSCAVFRRGNQWRAPIFPSRINAGAALKKESER